MKGKRTIGLSLAALLLASGAAFSAGDGKALFESKCTTCHAASRALSASKDQAGWEKTIERMRGKGAQVAEAEVPAIAEYLAKNAGK